MSDNKRDTLNHLYGDMWFNGRTGMIGKISRDEDDRVQFHPIEPYHRLMKSASVTNKTINIGDVMSDDETKTKPYELDLVGRTLRHAGLVKRYHTWSTRSQTVGEHCWQVYRVYCDLWYSEGVPSTLPGSGLSYYIMHHDSAELLTGDAPFPVKLVEPKLREAYDCIEPKANELLGIRWAYVSENDKLRVKVADMAEMLEYGIDEREAGNLAAVPIVERTQVAVVEAAGRIDHRHRVIARQYVEKLIVRHRDVLRSGDPRYYPGTLSDA